MVGKVQYWRRLELEKIKIGEDRSVGTRDGVSWRSMDQKKIEVGEGVSTWLN